MSNSRIEALEELLSIVDRLREPDGCPWDRKQSVPSMATYVLEEGFELVDAIENRDDRATAEELGDLLMVLAMICRIASEESRFDLESAARTVTEKLIRRHPHVFGDTEAETPEEVLANWEEIKRREREDSRRDASALAGLPRALPALLRSARTCEKAVAAGFAWSNAGGAWAKVEEELDELRQALEPVDLESGETPELDGHTRDRVEAELGDLLLAGAFLGTYLDIDPEKACRASLRRFELRFRQMESDLGQPLAEHPLRRMLEAWRDAKRLQG